MSEVKTNKITSLASNNDITLDPDGTGDVVVAAGHSVGIGTAAPDEYVHIKGASGAATDVQIQGGDDTNSVRLFMGGSSNRLNGRIVYDVANNAMALSTNGDERMRIDSSGQVMIGATTAGGQFTVTEGDATTIIDRVGTNVAGIKTGSGDDFCVGTADFAQAIRIKNSSGHVGVGTVAPSVIFHVENGDNEHAAFIHNSNASMSNPTLQVSTSRNTTNQSYNHFRCSIHGVANKFAVMDSGDVVSATNSYGQLSDQRMKENIVDAASQWDDIKALQVRKFNFIGSDLTQIGVVAQELEAAGMNGLITEAEWFDIDANPDNEVRKSVKYSVLYMKAIKALQEAIAKIETLETKVAALEAGE
jgi:hypothetical protein